jgi:hypothetical protein
MLPCIVEREKSWHLLSMHELENGILPLYVKGRIIY